MTPDTAEMAIVDPGELASEPRRGCGTVAPRVWRRVAAALGAIGPARMAAVRDTWRALWVSRLLVWVAGVGAMATVGQVARSAFDPPHVTGGFGWLGDLLAAPAARWDAAWYLVIAHYGYRPELGAATASRSAFFPLYPLGLRGISELGVPPVLAGVLLSLVALALALYGLHRLTTLEVERLIGSRTLAAGESPEPAAGTAPSRYRADAARLAVLATALGPMAFYFSAVYSESLYLALSVGVFWCARQGRWAWVGALGALAGATRSAGLVLVLPVAILYLYGPREDRKPDFPPRRRRVGGVRYRPRGEALWLAALPLGVMAYAVYLVLAGGSALEPFHAQEVWNRQFAGPYVGVWDAARAAFDGARQLLSFQRRHIYFAQSGGSPFVSAGHNLMLFAFLLAALPAIVGVLRRLPLAYGAYVLGALALPLSYPVAAQPLMSLPRFLVVLFPLSMWTGAFLAERPRARPVLLLGSALLLAFFAEQFATWHWVA
jgi:mannosyltransferase PIG-V